MELNETMNNEEMLRRIREDRPYQVIHRVISFRMNEFGFYEVEVDMETEFMDNVTKLDGVIIPYPVAELAKLSDWKLMGWEQHLCLRNYLKGRIYTETRI